MIATHNIKVNGRWVVAGEEYQPEEPEKSQEEQVEKLEKLEKLLHIGNIVIYVPFFLLIVSQCRHISVRI